MLQMFISDVLNIETKDISLFQFLIFLKAEAKVFLFFFSMFPDVLIIETQVLLLFQCFLMFQRLEQKVVLYFSIIVFQCSKYWNETFLFFSVFPNLLSKHWNKFSPFILVFPNVLNVETKFSRLFYCFPMF